MNVKIPFFAILIMTLLSCAGEKEEADLILTGGVIYTVDNDFTVAEAVAIRERRIAAVGSSREIGRKFRSAEVKDLEGACVYPGWIDAHCHFFGYGKGLNEADLTGTSSVEEIIELLKARQAENSGSWITGHGWDQNDWASREFPDRFMLDAHFPETPVMLGRIDGHAAWVNTRALELAGVTSQSQVEGGMVMLTDGSPSGILVDNAIGLVESRVPGPARDEVVRSLQQAERNCFQVGLTSVQDAGLSKSEVELIDSLNREGALQIRINAWLSPSEENFEHFVEKGTYRTDHLTVNTIKLFADGALGSRGARMMEPYTDDPGNPGLFVTPLDLLEQYCRRAHEHNYGVATHCIGDAANREVLKIYARILGGRNDLRWRIEHAQIINPEDFHYFGEYSIVPSVQATHATSDMYWAEHRVGPGRMRGAYAYRQLMEQNGWMPNGSDFPVEEINPLFGFYAATVRRDRSGYPATGFQVEDAISRKDALRAMTIWAAKSGFEEDLKGSIETGKLADLVVTTTDIMKAPDQELFRIRVKATYLGGEPVYEAMDN